MGDNMATRRITEAEAGKNFSALLQQVDEQGAVLIERAGSDLVVVPVDQLLDLIAPDEKVRQLFALFGIGGGGGQFAVQGIGSRGGQSPGKGIGGRGG
jgi:hypothetical protein